MNNDRYLFRGKRVDDGKWIEGAICTKAINHNICIVQENRNMYQGCEAIEVIPETVGQCVGLKDKNGRLIYEGDKLQYEAGYYEEDDEGDKRFIESKETVIVRWYKYRFTNVSHFRCDGKYMAEIVGNIRDEVTQ